jgi:UDPglucose 6-dehydrogenase
LKIAVVGTGYVGLVTGTCLSETGNNVICVDIDKSKIEKLNSGRITIYEPGLEKFFLRNIKENRLKFTTNLEKAVEDVDIIFLALPTPPGEDGSADLKYILDVAEQLGKIIKNYKVIVNKSTVPVGTADKVKSKISINYKHEFDVVSNPEFLREGVAVDDFMKPDRVVVGTRSEKAKRLMSELYSPFLRQGNPIIFMDERSSELTKYAANSFLATKISFMNEISQLCERFGADVDKVRLGIGSDERIGRRFLFPGIGYGGSCFPKDVKALIMSSNDVNYNFEILNAVEKVNNNQKEFLVDKIKLFYENDLKGKKFALWGLAFKPNTDDIREAPSLTIVDSLVKLGAKINSYDPEAMDNVKELIGNKISYASSQYEAIENADALIIVTEWSEFRTPDFKLIGNKIKHKVIFDGRNLFDVSYMKDIGYQYYSVGRMNSK